MMSAILKLFILSYIVLFVSLASYAKPTCELSYLTKSAVKSRASSSLTNVSKSINKLLKSSFDFANKLDHYTLGLASAVTLGHALGSAHSLEDIKPNQWNKAKMVGVLLYQDSPFALTPIRGATVKVASQKSTHLLSTGMNGEFSGSFYKIVPYKRIRLFPGLIFEKKNKLVKSIQVPLTINVISNFCEASIYVSELPLEPVTLILSKKDQEQKNL